MKFSSLLGSVVLASLLVGCGTDDGACCESNLKTVQKLEPVITSKIPETKIVVDTYLDTTNLQGTISNDHVLTHDNIDDSTQNKNISRVTDISITNDNESSTLKDKPTTVKEFTNLPPVAVIDISNSDSSYTISCKDSYDTDEDGDGIKQCNWNIVSYDEHGCPHKTYKRYDVNNTQDAFIVPCHHVKYIEVKLTVIDNEGSHDCVKQKIEVR